MSFLQSQSGARRFPWMTWLVFLLGFYLLMMLCFSPGNALAFDVEPVQDFGQNWELLDEAGQAVQGQPVLTLPARVDAKTTVRIGKTVPGGLSYPAVLGFRSAHQKVRLYCDGELLYSFGYDNLPKIGKSPGGAWNIVRLPQNAQGKQLVLEFTSPYAAYVGKIESIQVGSKVALIFALLRTYALSFVITLAIFVVGIVTLIIDFLVIRKDSMIGGETFYLGLFAVFISLWLFGEGRLTQFFGVPPAVNTCLVFLCMMATPIPLIYYIACGRRPKTRRLLHLTANILSCIFAVCVMLQLVGILDFMEQIVFIHATLILTCAVLLYAVGQDMKNNQDADLRRLTVSMCILAFCFFIETVGIYVGTKSVGNMMRIGVLIFIAVQAQSAFTKASKIMKMSRLASVDALTGCMNRTAYHQRLEELTGLSNVGIVIADINDLKFINDTYGHDTGDDAIIRCSKCFTEAFLQAGSCFRIGGDEFVMMGKNISLAWMDDMGKTFEARTQKLQEQTDYPFSASYGYALFDPMCDSSIPDTLARADKAMYQSKRLYKQQKSEAK